MQRLVQSNQQEAQREEPVIEKANAAVEPATVDVERDSETGSLSTVPSAIDMSRKASCVSKISGRWLGRTATQYEENPYDFDRINTRNSAISGHYQRD